MDGLGWLCQNLGMQEIRHNVLRQIKSVPEANCCVRKNRTEGDYYWGSH